MKNKLGKIHDSFPKNTYYRFLMARQKATSIMRAASEPAEPRRITAPGILQAMREQLLAMIPAAITGGRIWA